LTSIAQYHDAVSLINFGLIGNRVKTKEFGLLTFSNALHQVFRLQVELYATEEREYVLDRDNQYVESGVA
jgi:hypothetical protein